MQTLSTLPADCKYHLEALTFRCDVQHQQCCESVDEVAWYFAVNAFVWTGRRFYRPACLPGECPLEGRVLDQSAKEFLSAEDLEALVVPLFYRWAESSAARENVGVG